MAKLLKLRRGTTSQHGSFTGAEGEVTVDTDKETLVVHDGSTAGGHAVAAEDMANVSSASIVGRLGTGSIVKAKLEADIIDSTKLADDSVNSEHYVDGSIDTAHIADAQVTHVKLANDCIDGDNIQDDVVNSEHIAAGAVDLEHMSSESVDEDNLKISNAGTNGQFLSKQSGDAGGLTWATVASTAADFTVTANNSTDETVYPIFVDGATGAQGAESDTGLTYNPSTGNLTSTTFTGNIVGNVTGNATSASTGTTVTVTANESTDELLYLAMVDGTSGSQAIEADSSLQYNPSTGIITTTGFSGSGVNLTALNASNIASGTIAAARVPTLNQNTTGSSASCTGNAATASSVSGSQTGITAVGSLSSLYTTGPQTQAIKSISGTTIYGTWGNYWYITISSNTTISFSSVPSNSYAMVLEIDHNGGSITWPSSVKWNGDAAPTLTTGKTHQFYFHTRNSGSRWRGAALVDYVD